MPTIHDKNDVIERLCMLCCEVMHFKYRYRVPADCFCPKAEHPEGQKYQFDSDVLTYIEEAVRAKLVMDKVTNQ